MSLVLVTGAHGNLGRAVIDALGASHTAIRSDVGPDNGGDSSYRQADLRSFDDACRVITAEIDLIVHCPAWHGVHAHTRDPLDYWQLNVDGTFHTLEAAAQVGVQRVVWASSAVFYGPVGSPYCFSKHVGELICDHFRARTGLHVARMRYTDFTPPRDFLDYGLRMLDGRGLDRRDAGAATARAVDALLAGRLEDDFFDVVCGTPFNDRDRQEWGDDPWVVLNRHWPDHVELLKTHLAGRLPPQLADPGPSEKLRTGLGYVPMHNFGRFVEELAERQPSGDLSAPEGYCWAACLDTPS